MRNWLIVLLSSVVVLSGLTACGPIEEDPTAGWSPNKLYFEAHEALNEGNYETAVQYFESLEAKYPFGRFAQQAQLETAYAYFKYGEDVSALAAIERFIKLNPRHPNIAYAYYLKGLVNMDRSTGLFGNFLGAKPEEVDPSPYEEAFKDFTFVVTHYPDSDYAADSRQRAIYLRNVIAEFELNVADYYVRKEAWVAASQRANYVLEHYPQTPAALNAIDLLIVAYDKLSLPDLAADMRKLRNTNTEKGS